MLTLNLTLTITLVKVADLKNILTLHLTLTIALVKPNIRPVPNPKRNSACAKAAKSHGKIKRQNTAS